MIITNVVALFQLAMVLFLSLPLVENFHLLVLIYFWVMAAVLWVMALEKDFLLEELPHQAHQVFVREVIRSACFALYTTMCGMLAMGRVFHNNDLFQFGLTWALFAILSQLACDAYYGKLLLQPTGAQVH